MNNSWPLSVKWWRQPLILTSIVEIGFWMFGLLILALQDPDSSRHLTLFWPSWIWDIRSPGYNLGHSITFAIRGNLIESWQAHYLGVPVLLILICRIISLSQEIMNRRH